MTSATPRIDHSSVITLAMPTSDCEACRQAVVAALQQLDGVQLAAFDADGRLARVTFDPAATNQPAIVAYLTEAGYPPEDLPSE